jgi:hypothetical protein
MTSRIYGNALVLAVVTALAACAGNLRKLNRGTSGCSAVVAFPDRRRAGAKAGGTTASAQFREWRELILPERADDRFAHKAREFASPPDEARTILVQALIQDLRMRQTWHPVQRHRLTLTL